ncbi:hypothetical protein Y1Q_0014007 [Alligator mississippiensis]|uniref:EGF-like domain-containing protein n=1 Tax=Alligator mississippiensis TaxID=8496 RepID=A0A151PDB7_ALLMI|nr:hypothetical protein Y1Q_0014007 [Alligator mississippiensis]
MEINECNSLPCLHGSTCEDHINGYACKCQQGWEGLNCEEDTDECRSNPCVNGICIQREPTHGFACFCKPGFVGRSCELNYNDCLLQTCSVGFLCTDGINNITCLPAIPQSNTAITKMEGVSLTEDSLSSLTLAWSASAKLWSTHTTCDVHTRQAVEGLKKTDIFSYGILLTTNSAKLNSSTTFESYGLGGLTDTGEPSTIFKLSSTDVLSSHFLSSVAQLSAQMKSDITPVPYGAIGTSIDLTSLRSDLIFESKKAVYIENGFEPISVDIKF